MTTQIAKIKNGSIPIPKEWLVKWKDAEVFLSPSDNTIMIKKIEQPSLSRLKLQLKELGKRISERDIRNTIRAVRAANK